MAAAERPADPLRRPRCRAELRGAGVVRRPPRLRLRRRRRGRHPLRRDARQGHLLGADARGGAAPPRRDAGEVPDPRAAHQPRPAGQRAAPRGGRRRARSAPTSSTGTASTSSRPRRPTSTRCGSARSPPRWPAPSGTRPHARVQPRIPVGWRNVVSAPQLTRFVCENSGPSHGPTADESGWWTCTGTAGATATGSSASRTPRSPRSWSTPARTGWCLEHDGMRRTFEVLLDDDGSVDVESSLGHVALRRTPRFVDPADQVATGSLLAPMPGTSSPWRSRSGTRWPAGSRCWSSRR